jgi:hypothetical protein
MVDEAADVLPVTIRRTGRDEPGVLGADTVSHIPQTIGWVKISLYGLRRGQAQVQVGFPNGTRSGQADLATGRAQLRELLHGEIDRAFDAFGTR